jgi:hypothetical protein
MRMLFEVTDAIAQSSRAARRQGRARAAQEGESNYAKFLAFNDHIVLERGCGRKPTRQRRSRRCIATATW